MQSLLSRVQSLQKNPVVLVLAQQYWWRAVLIFIVVSSLFTWLMSSTTFADPDSFYHVGMAEYLWEHKSIPHEFPWLSQTTLADHYTDHHFLYHVALIPFVTLLPPFLGAKLLTIFLAGALFAATYYVLARANVRYASAWMLVLLSCSGLLFRLGLVKAPAVSLLFLLAGFWLLRTPHNGRRILLLFPLSFLFVWSYGGFIVLLLLACCIAIGWLLYGVTTVRSWESWKQLFLEQAFAIACVGVGMLFGLLIHPSFPDHLFLLWQQIVEIGIINQKDIISVGREWYPPTLGLIIRDQWLLCIAALIGLVAGIQSWRKLHPETLGVGIFALILVLFTMRSQRYVEYAVPWLFIATVFAFRDSAVLERTFTAIRRYFHHKPKTILRSPTHTTMAAILLVTSVLSIAVIAMIFQKAFTGAYRDLHSGIEYSTSRAAAEWLQANTDEHSVVYTSDWDIFPELFYYNRHNYYIVGLDPTFMYNHSPENYWRWYNINTGIQKTGISDDIINRFNSRTIIVESDNTWLQNHLQADPTVTREYTDAHYSIYSIHAGDSRPVLPTEDETAQE